MQNPYTHRSTVRDQAMFFGRTRDLARIYALLANTQSVSIVGDRRIGKSSLLYCLARPEVQARQERHNLSDYCFVYVDLQGSVYRNAVEFLQHLLHKLQRQVNPTWLLDLGQAATPQDTFETAVAQLNKQGVKLVFLLDEFDYVTRNEHLDAALFSFMRYMATNYDLAIVTASQQRLVDLCHTDIIDSPFFNIFARITLGPLERSEALELITIPSRAAGYPLEDDADWLLKLAGMQPICLQIACFYLLEARAHAAGGKRVDYDAARQLFYDEARDHFHYAWIHLSEQERDRLKKEAWQEQGPFGHYLAESSAFRQFVCRQNGVAQVSRVELITEEEVETALKNFWKITELGQNPLTGLNLVRRQLSRSGLSPLVPNLGRALQDTLQTAIDHLKTGEREDLQSRQGRSWYILQQCYVEEEPNQDTARRLNVAERTFYRERREAIKAVVNILQELEANVFAE
jgi:hypothetical protein